jgi:hypothetical protein
MISDATLYLHIGLPKTGTTFLQDRIFPELPSTGYLRRPEGDVVQGHPGPRYGLLDRCFKRSAAIWEEFGDRIFAELWSRFSPGEAERRILISDEGIGTIGRKPLFLRTHLQELAANASDWGVTSVRVICSFRRQDQWLGSHFAQMSNRNPSASQEDFEAFVERFLEPGADYFWDGILLDFKRLRDNLVAGLGEENVLMLPYETLSEDPAGYLGALFGFLGFGADSETLRGSLTRRCTAERSNTRTTGSDRWAVRPHRGGAGKRVRFHPGRILQAIGLADRIPASSSAAAGREEEIRMTEPLRRRILSRYAGSNAALAADLGMDLRRFAYH